MFVVGNLRIGDAKPIVMFGPGQETRFLTACDDWEFSVFFTSAKLGSCPGELVHTVIEDLYFRPAGCTSLASRISVGRSRPASSAMYRCLRKELIG